MFPYGDAQPVHIMPSDNTARISRDAEHDRENGARPDQMRPHVGRLQRLLNRLKR